MSYIIGFPGDTKKSILRDIAIIQRERVLHADAAARLGGSQNFGGQRGVDGSRLEQIRPQSLRHTSFEDVGRGTAIGLPRAVGDLLHTRARAHYSPPRHHLPTGRTFHRYVYPERDMPAEAVAMHGLTAAFLTDKPLFAAIADEE